MRYARTIFRTIKATTATRNTSGTPALTESMIIERWSDFNTTTSVILAPRSYYVMITRQTAFPPSWRWRIVRRGEPMGVQIEGDGFTTYVAARLAGGRVLADFLEQLELEEKSRIERRAD